MELDRSLSPLPPFPEPVQKGFTSITQSPLFPRLNTPISLHSSFSILRPVSATGCSLLATIQLVCS